jgi:hypothetical protein
VVVDGLLRKIMIEHSTGSGARFLLHFPDWLQLRTWEGLGPATHGGLFFLSGYAMKVAALIVEIRRKAAVLPPPHVDPLRAIYRY